MATLTLYPKYITAGASFNGILSTNGTGTASKDIAASGTDVGTIVFDTSPLHDRSSACIFTGYSVSYRQRCNINQWSKLYWKMTPKKVTSYSLNSNGISIRSSITFGRNTSSDTTGDGWVDFGKSFIDSDNLSSYSSSAGGLFGGTNLLGFFLRGDNDHSVGSYKLWMNNLRASVSYTPRYIATFYDNENDMNVVGSMTLDANNAPNIGTAESYYSRTGYQIVGWKCVAGDSERIGDTYLYSLGAGIGSSCDTDIGWVPIWEPVKYSVSAYPHRTETAAGIYIEKYVNNALEHQTPSSVNQSNYAYYQLNYGDRIRFVADGYRVDQNVVYSSWSSAGAGSGTLDGSSGWPIVVLEDSGLDREAYVRVEAVQDVVFAIETSKTGNGFITASQNAPRGSAASVTILPDTGWLLSTYTVDGLERSATQYEQTNGTVVRWQSVDTYHTVSAVFVKQPIQITSTLPNGVTVKDGSGNTVTFPDTVNYGDNKTYVFSCDNTKSLLTITADGTNMMDPVFKQVTSFELPLSNITETHAFGGTLTGDLVTVTIQQTTGGTVTCAELPDGSGKFLPDVGTLTFRATPNAYYNFVGWSTGSAERTLTVDVTGTLTVSADFDPAQIEIQTALICEEELDFIFEKSVNGAWVPASKYCDYGDTIRISLAYPDRPQMSRDTVLQWSNWGYENPTFVVVSAPEEGEGTEKTGTRTVTVTIVGETTVEATVKRQLFYMGGNCVPPSGGEIVFSVEPNEVGRHKAETELRVSAIPAPGYYFLCWAKNGNVSYVDEHGGFSIDQSLNFVVPYWKNGTERTYISIKYAHFRQIEYEVTISADEGGTVSGGGLFHYGDQTSITIRTDYGFKIKDVLLDGVSVYEDVMLTWRGGIYELKDIDASHTVEVRFGPRFFSHDRKLLDYYPPVIKSIYEIQALMAALQVQDDAMFDAASFIFENQFIESASVEGVSRWERELGIIPAPTDTLRQRKERLRIKWVPKPRFTMQWLRKWLETVCGQAVRDPVLTDYSLRVTLPGGVDWMTIFDDLKRYKPANIVLDPRVLMPRGTKHIYVGTATMISNHDSPIIHTLTVEGE